MNHPKSLRINGINCFPLWYSRWCFHFRFMLIPYLFVKHKTSQQVLSNSSKNKRILTIFDSIREESVSNNSFFRWLICVALKLKFRIEIFVWEAQVFVEGGELPSSPRLVTPLFSKLFYIHIHYYRHSTLFLSIKLKLCLFDKIHLQKNSYSSLLNTIDSRLSFNW